MKTFKLYSFCLLEGKSGKVEKKPIPIQDGLIINLENSEHTWYIDAVFSADQFDYFKDLHEQGAHILVDVIITSKDNHPATMISSVQTITSLSEQISILFEAKLAKKKDDVVENVLEDLVEKGYKEDSLLSEFRSKMENLAAHSQQSLDELYRSLQNSGQYNLK
ncbi:YwpF family protein [Halalkalibacter nanhaiisediminis]|uniref:YwpF-like protein n=1 Tax=Halalkalibacter nanhaiisediminis TaxID=688079 RepID=A0A562QJJ4_9BACI|nr:YwpF family protein [Halalkalibacter nanhaiisediminis]TWI56885.1 YwpF-like protein [Halalkalibacter nanhaiisediminis]